MSKPNKFDYQKFNHQLNTDIAKIQLGKPKQNKPFIEALDEWTQINKTPKSNGQAAIEGAVAGLKSGLKAADQDRDQKVFDWLEANVRESQKLIDYNIQQEQRREEIFPYASGAIRLAYSDADYDTINNNARSMWEQAKMKGLVKGNFVSLVPKTTVANYQNDDGSFAAIDLGTFAPEVAKEAADMRVKNLSLGINQQRADDYGRNVQSQIDLRSTQADLMGDRLNLQNRRAETAEENARIAAERVKLSKANTIHKTVGEELDAKREFLRDAPRITEIVRKNPGIFQSLAQIQWSNPDPTYFETVTRNLVGKFRNPEDKRDIAVLVKAINKMKIDVSKGFVRPNQFLEKTAAGAVPNFNMPPEAFLKVMDNMIDDAEYDAKKYEQRIKAIDNEEGQLAKAWINSPQSQGMSQPIQNSDPNTITMRSPDGKIGKIPLSKVEKALRQGGVIIEQ